MLIVSVQPYSAVVAMWYDVSVSYWYRAPILLQCWKPQHTLGVAWRTRQKDTCPLIPWDMIVATSNGGPLHWRELKVMMRLRCNCDPPPPLRTIDNTLYMYVLFSGTSQLYYGVILIPCIWHFCRDMHLQCTSLAFAHICTCMFQHRWIARSYENGKIETRQHIVLTSRAIDWLGIIWFLILYGHNKWAK